MQGDVAKRLFAPAYPNPAHRSRPSGRAHVHCGSRSPRLVNRTGGCAVPHINSGDTGWLLASGALLMFMTPGLAFFNSPRS